MESGQKPTIIEVLRQLPTPEPVPLVNRSFRRWISAMGDFVPSDLAECVLIQRDPRADSAMHVRFGYDGRAFRAAWRVNGARRRSTAPRAFKGSASMSPFVTVEARQFDFASGSGCCPPFGARYSFPRFPTNNGLDGAERPSMPRRSHGGGFCLASWYFNLTRTW